MLISRSSVAYCAISVFRSAPVGVWSWVWSFSTAISGEMASELMLAQNRVPEGFSYDSGTNGHFLTVEEIRMLIRQHIDPAF